MTKKEMKRRLDITMLEDMKMAVWCADKGYKSLAVENINVAMGTVYSASILDLITDEEFDNINHSLSSTRLRW